MSTTYDTDSIVEQPQADSQLRWLFETREMGCRLGLPKSPGPAITISYQTGAGENEVARILAQVLQRTEPDKACQWAVFDRQQLVEKVLEEHHLPKEMAKVMPEERRSYIQDVMEEAVGLRPPSWVIVPQIAETVVRLADTGHVILVGRAANFITAHMPKIFHVRLIASWAKRVERVQRLDRLNPKQAAKFIEQGDRHRQGYIRTHFHGSPEDGTLYHLLINTDRIPCPEAAELIADAARKSWQD
jgi:cytidylate kinase